MYYSIPEDDKPRQMQRRLLVVDDQIDAAETLAMLLRLEGHIVEVAADGPSALAKLQEYSPEIVFLDIGLPGMNGFEIIHKIRANPNYADMVIVALTGYGDAQDCRQSIAAGFDHFLTKPVPLTAIAKVMLMQRRPEALSPRICLRAVTPSLIPRS